jgi:precorrin-6Y C5,15-methyltransferase (decarboxylating)
VSEIREPRIVVIGVSPLGGLASLGAAEQDALAGADVIAGARRFIGDALVAQTDRIEITGAVATALDAIASARAGGKRVVVLASGDPGYFGIGRVLAERFGTASLDVRPALSSVASAFGRIGLPWDDAVVVSAHGRPLDEAVAAIPASGKAAVLTSPENPPERVGAELGRRGDRFDRVVVVSELGLPNESVVEGPSVEWLAAGRFPALSVVLLISGDGVGPAPAVASKPAAPGRSVLAAPGRPVLAAPGRSDPATFGRDESEYEHRAGMITKAEIRAVVLARLALPGSGVLWDIGAGSGSIGIEAARLAPALRVFAVEQQAADAARIRANAARHGVTIEVVEASAPEALASLPTPDRVIVGGGGLDVLDACLSRLAAGGRMVATFTSLDRALGATARLGNLVQIAVSRGTQLPDSTHRLAALDPVFVCWGPW